MNDPIPQIPRTHDHNFENPFDQNHSRLSQIDGTCSSSNDHEFLQFTPNSTHQDGDDSGVCSPPLWKNTASPPRPLSHRNLSPDSRLRAIARGQRELMEMVRIMPESSYELSLKDLVEHHRIENQNPKSIDRNSDRGGEGKIKRQESRKNDRNLVRVESFESKGLFLNMVFPFSLNSKRKKRSVGGCSGRVSPKPEVAKGGGGGERDWWKKKFTGSGDSNSGGGGGSSSGRSDGGKKMELLRSCWPFLQSRGSKSVD